MKVRIPEDRTNMQPIIAQCNNPQCSENGQSFKFVHEHGNEISCPKCHASQSPMISMLVLIHFLVRDDKGLVIGDGGLRYKLACDQKRAYLATYTNQEAATGLLECANCPQCLENARQLGIKINGFELLMQPQGG